MSYRPFISVVVPTFNRARQVQGALMSVLAQTYREFEIIVVDDGSADGTREAVQRLVSQQLGDIKQIRYCFQPNQGPSAARNKGIAEACGDWIAFLDSDDVWLPEKLEWQVRAIEESKEECGACITDAKLIDDLGMDTTAFRESGKRYPMTIGTDLGAAERLAKSFDHYWLSAFLARADVVREAGQFDPLLIFNEDNDFFFRLSLATTFCYVNKPLLVIDRTCSPPGSKCRPWDQVDVRLRGRQLMLEKWLTLDLKLTPEVRRTITQNLRHVYSAWANVHLEHERYEEARQAVSKAIRYECTSKLAIKWALTYAAPSVARMISPKMTVSY
jgi:glycosyltransferase involved in cell wall biosynthesis